MLTTAALVLSPDQVVIGGMLVELHPALVDRVAARVTRELAAVGSGPPVVRAARLGDDDGALGAVAALVQRSPLLAGYHEPLDPDAAAAHTDTETDSDTQTHAPRSARA